MQAFDSSTFSCRTVNFFTKEFYQLYKECNQMLLTLFAWFRIDEIHLCLIRALKLTVSLTFINSRHLTISGSCYFKQQIDVSFSCVCPLVDDKLLHASKFPAVPLWQCHDAIYHQLGDRRTDCLFVDSSANLKK